MPIRQDALHSAGSLATGAAPRRALSISAVTVAAVGLFWPASLATSTVAEAKTPGKTYCFLGKCHRVRTLAETQSLVGARTVVKASHYDDPRRDRFNPSNLTSSGEWFRAAAADNAASPTLPNGTVLLVYSPVTRKAAVVRVNNAGPYWGNRTLDVSRGAAEKLGFARQGVSTLITQVIRAPTRDEATYRKGRRYAAVPGFIGTHASVEGAVADARRRMGGSSPAPEAPAISTGTAVASAALDRTPRAAATARPAANPVVASAPLAVGSFVAKATPAEAPAPVTPSPLPGEGGKPTPASTSATGAVVASSPRTAPVRTAQARTPAPRTTTRPSAVEYLTSPAPVPRRTATAPTSPATSATTAGRRRSLDANGYFTVDCRSMPELCGGSGTSSTRSRPLRTSAVSSSNRP